ncbi:MAG: NADH-quinone oxidoreductase subunit D, partial [Verrucomicrobia bacterium]
MKTSYEAPDTLAKANQVRDDYNAEANDLHGERMTLNMGPSHPATHGVLRLILELDGETIISADPDVGFLHRGDEKIAENMHYNQFIPYTDRLDYLAPLANNVAYACAVEKLMGWELPPRGQALRVLCCELARISAHMLGVGVCAMDVGAMTVFLYTFTEREKVYNLCEQLTGARFTTSYTRVGGQLRDMPAGFEEKVRTFLDECSVTIEEIAKLLDKNKIFIDRMADIGVISREEAISWGMTGPNLRASGVTRDLRKDNPYLGYEKYEFDIPIAEEGDCYARYQVRMEEMRQSIKICRQVLDTMPEGPVNLADSKSMLPDKER